MKNKTICGICHDVIETQHVFSEDNQVFVKQVILKPGKVATDKWFPINFHWASDLELRNSLITQSNME